MLPDFKQASDEITEMSVQLYSVSNKNNEHQVKIICSFIYSSLTMVNNYHMKYKLKKHVRKLIPQQYKKRPTRDYITATYESC